MSLAEVPATAAPPENEASDAVAAAAASPWGDALVAACLFAVDPVGTGGITLRAGVGPVRDRWLAAVGALLPAGTPVRRMPPHIDDGRLLGGLDLAATLSAGRPVAERGLLAEADGGVVVVPMAERLPRGTAARLASALDRGEIVLERDGLGSRAAARLGVVALDEGLDAEERPPEALLDRLAFPLDLDGVPVCDTTDEAPFDRRDVTAARDRLAAVTTPDTVLSALCAAPLALGIRSLRASMLALAAARAAAALDGRTAVAEADAALAARLVLAPRATVVPVPEAEDQTEEMPEPEPPKPPDGAEEEERAADAPLEDRVLAAAEAALPADLLMRLRSGRGVRARATMPGRAGVARISVRRGRPIGSRPGKPCAGARVNVIDTLRAAAPWQRLRRREPASAEAAPPRPARVEVRRDDFRVTRFKQRTETAVVFVVDASGSAAMHRLAEAKGAVELLLADCYRRRDQVALIAFRGQGAELLLPPTRSLVRARRELAGLPGGGGTPVAAGLDAAAGLAEALGRRGLTPMVVMLTDGRANIARDGSPGRARAAEDALAAARRLRGLGLAGLLVDTAPRPQAPARGLAEAMGADYLPLPYADARALSEAIRASAGMPGATAS